jgi:hypothetical protein
MESMSDGNNGGYRWNYAILKYATLEINILELSNPGFSKKQETVIHIILENNFKDV